MILGNAIDIARPEIVLSAGALVLLVIGAFRGDKGTAGVALGSGIMLVVAAVLAAVGPIGSAFNGGFVADQATAFCKVVIYLLSAIAILLGERWLTRIGGAKFEYPVLILLASLGMGMMVSAGDLISLYVGIELMSVPTYVLAAFRRDDAKSSEAGLKYFILGALSSGLLLYGASLIYGFAGSTKFVAIAHAVAAGGSGGTIFGIVFLICGLAFKVSAAPFHMWTPDVYEGAPTPVVAFLTAAPKLAAMVLFARATVQAFPGAAMEQWRQVLLAIAIISMVWGALAGLAQQNLKRLWAYSSIANIGYALVGLSAGSAEGVQSMLVFMVLYMVDVTGFFACLIALRRDGRPMETFADMSGLMRERPGFALAMTAFSLSALGLPPLSGFWAKVYVFKAIIDAGYGWVAVVGLLSSVIAAAYYLRLIKTMWFDPAPGRVDAPPGEAVVIAYGAALFSFPLMMLMLRPLDQAAQLAATAFHLR